MLVVILFIIFLIVIFVIAGILITRSAVQIKKISDYSTNSKLQAAHRTATLGAIVNWVTVGFAVIALIVGFFFGADEYEAAKVLTHGPGKFMYVLIFILFALTIFDGVIAAIVSVDIKTASGYNESDPTTKDARDSAIWAAILAFVSVGLILILYIAYAVRRRQAKDIKVESGGGALTKHTS